MATAHQVVDIGLDTYLVLTSVVLYVKAYEMAHLTQASHLKLPMQTLEQLHNLRRLIL